MPSLPPNDVLRSRLAGFYLGDLDTPSRLQWMYSKIRRCQVLSAKSTSPSPNPMLAILHGCFKITQNPFFLFPDGGFNVNKEHYRKSSNEEEAMGKADAWAHLGRIDYHKLLGYEDFPIYMNNLHALENLLRSGQSSQYSILNKGVHGEEVKIIHRMFEVSRVFSFFSVSQ